jgi:hypothetical protein
MATPLTTASPSTVAATISLLLPFILRTSLVFLLIAVSSRRPASNAW